MNQIVNIFIFVNYSVSVSATQPFYCRAKAALGAMSLDGHDCIPQKLYLQKQAMGQI